MSRGNWNLLVIIKRERLISVYLAFDKKTLKKFRQKKLLQSGVKEALEKANQSVTRRIKETKRGQEELEAQERGFDRFSFNIRAISEGGGYCTCEIPIKDRLYQ